MSEPPAPATDRGPATGDPAASPLEVLKVAGRLGLTSFGGPIAHLGYFHREYVERRAWLDEAAYADLVALCQSLPGPASSQLGIAIGTHRAGIRGGLAAWFGFTLPSVVVLVAFGFLANSVDLSQAGWVHGLKLAAVAVVAQAVWLMARTLTPDWPRRGMAFIAAALALAWTSAFSQVSIILGGAFVGWLVLRPRVEARTGSDLRVVPRRIRHRRPRPVRRPAPRAALAERRGWSSARVLRGLLSVGCPRLWRRPSRTATPPHEGGRSGLGDERPVPGRLRRCPGGSGASFLLLRLPRHRRGPGTQRRGGSVDRRGRDLPARDLSSSSAACRSGRGCAARSRSGGRWPGPMPRSWGSWWPRSIRPSGRARLGRSETWSLRPQRWDCC